MRERLRLVNNPVGGLKLVRHGKNLLQCFQTLQRRELKVTLISLAFRVEALAYFWEISP